MRSEVDGDPRGLSAGSSGGVGGAHDVSRRQRAHRSGMTVVTGLIGCIH